jgi:hypothetical protein
MFRRDTRALFKPFDGGGQAAIDEDHYRFRDYRIDALTLTQGALVRSAFRKQDCVSSKLQTLCDEMWERTRASLRPLKRRDHPQHVRLRSLFGHAAKDVQAGRNKSLLNLKQLLIESQHAAVARFT